MKRRQSKYITRPSFFWEDFLAESHEDLSGNSYISTANQASNRAGALIDRTNQRIKAIWSDPTASDPQKKVRIQKIAKDSKRQMEEIINSYSRDFAKSESDINNKIQENISSADRIMATETRQRLAAMNETQRASFIRQLHNGGDFESLGHVLGRSPAFYGMDPEEYSEVKEMYISGAHPEKATDLKALQIAQNNLKRGWIAVMDDFEDLTSDNSDTKRAEEAKTAMAG